jgi:acyl carrier protein
MTKEEIIKEINNIFIDVLDDEDIAISEATTSDDIDDWDSLNHIHLVVAIEKHFKLRFTSQEIQSWNNVGEMILNMQEKGI